MALILVADDQPANRQFLTTLLGYCGHRSIEAADGAGALAACRAQRPDLVIADILMPTMDGYEFVRMLRQDQELATTPVVFWSAIYHEREARALAESCGVRHLIIKPSDPEAILEVVAAALRQPSPPVMLPVDEFARDHSRLLVNKLASTAEELTAANSRLAALLDIGQQLAAERDPDRLVQSFCPAARDLMGCRYAGILLLSDGRLSVPVVAGMEAEALERAGPWVAELPALREALVERRLLRVVDVRPHAAALGPYFTNGSLLAAPLRTTNGPLGIAFFLDKLGQPEFGEEDEQLAITLAAQVGVALENALNYASVQRHAADLEREIEDRKEAERALRASEQKFAKIFYANPRPMVISSLPTGAVVELNDSLVEATGFTREELLGKTDAQLPMWEGAGARQLSRALKSGTLPRDLNCIFRTKAGETRIGMVSAERIDLNGMPCRLWILKDVTEQKEADQALRESREDLNRAQAVAHTGSWRLDVRRNELRWSDETYRIFGIPQGTPLTYEVFLNAVHRDDRDMVDRAWRAALAGEPYDVEHRIIVGSAVKWVRERAELEFDGQGTVLSGFGTSQDITERKWSEQRIRDQNTVLEGINRIFREALTCDTEEQLGRTCLAVAEEVTQSKFGFISEINAQGRLDVIAISDPGWEVSRIASPADRRQGTTGFAIRGLYGRVVLDGKGFFTNEPCSHPDSIGLPEGHPPLAAFLGVPLVSAGEAFGIIAVANREGGYVEQDLEALEALAAGVVQVLMRKRAERALRAGEERLRQAQKMESIGLLAGGIAHDFNNLLTTIMGNTSLLRDESPKETRGLIDSVIQATEKAADLTRQLLAYAGKGRFVIERLNLSRIVRDLINLLRASVPKKVTMNLALASGLPGIEADRGQLQQIVMNLVLNAAEAIGSEAGTVTIATRSRHVAEYDGIADEITGDSLAPGDYVCLEVTDTGCGMDPEMRTKIFDPFFTTKFVGRGLGLAAVAGILQSHHGAIQLETEPGRGSTFRVFLPAGAPPEAPRSNTRRLRLRGSGTVLVVEDEEMVLDFTRSALERYGYQVLVAQDGRQAIRVFEENREQISVVLLDVMMPVMGGDEAIGMLKEKCPDLRVIVMSGYSETEARRLFAGKGVLGFLQKPFAAMRLAEELKRVLTAPAGITPR